MIDPVRQRQIDELNEVELGHEILGNARIELYLNFRYLDVALSSFGFEADRSGSGLSTDGYVIYYQPDMLFSMFREAVYGLTGHIFICFFTVYSGIWDLWETVISNTGIWRVI